MYRKIAKHRIFKNTTALLIMQLFTYVSPFIVLPYLTRVLGVDGFGMMVAALSLTIIANVCTDFGFNLSATYLISRKKNQVRYISRIITVIYALKLTLLGIVFIGIALYLWLAVDYTGVAIAAIYGAVFFQAFMSPWLFQGIEKMKLITYSTIASRLMYVVLILLLVKEKDDYDIALICNAVAVAIGCLLSNMLIFKEGFGFAKPSRRLVKLMFTHSSQFFASRVTLQASSSISVLVLNGAVSTAQVGLFGASQKLYNSFKQLINPFSQALYPYMASTGNTRLLLKLIAVIGVVMAVPVMIGWIYAENVLTLVFGADFAQSSEVLRVFILTGYVAFLSICFGYPAFAALKRVDLANKSVIVSGTCQLVFLVVMFVFDKITIMNVAYSIFVTEGLTLALRLYWFATLSRIMKGGQLVKS